MKKRILSIFLAVIMAFSLLPVSAFAVVETNWAKLSTAMAGEAQETVPGVFEVDDTTTPGARAIKLLTNITAGESDTYFNVSGSMEIVLDLNNHTLDRGLAEKEATAKGYIMNIGTGASLTIKNGTITGANATGHAALYCDTTKKLDLIDVNLVNCKRGALYLEDVDRANIEGCTFSGNTTSVSGAAVDAESLVSKPKTITITDCLFENNISGGSGSAMRIYGEKNDSYIHYDVTIKNSTFTGNAVNSVRSPENKGDGGTICAYRVNSLTLDGCTITGNTALENNSCGGLAVGQYIKTFIIKGKTVIADNTCGGQPADLCSRSNLARVKLKGLAEGSRIGVGTTYSVAAVSPVTFATNATAGDLKYFFSDSAEYYVDFKTNHLDLVAPVAGKYAINVLPSENGTVTTSVKEAAENASVTVTVTPDSGYQLKSLNYNDGADHDITEAKSFTMPNKAVTVTAEFISNWPKLSTAMAGGAQATVPGVFEVDDTTTPGTRTIKLLTNITAASEDTVITVPEDKDIILDLNGHVINAKGTFSAERRAFEVSGKLTIEDSSDTGRNGSGTGKITGGFMRSNGSAMKIKADGEVIINSGAICNNYAADINEVGKGGGAIACFGKLTINGGALHHNKARWGGAIGLNKGAEFLMTGGRIYENEALVMDGAAINMETDYTGEGITSTIIGGEITGNISNVTTDGVDADETKNGVASAGNAVWVEGELYIGGTAKIYRNKQGYYNEKTGKWSNLKGGADLAIVDNNVTYYNNNKGRDTNEARGTLKVSAEYPLAAGANICLSKTSEHKKIVPFAAGDALADYDITTENGFTAENCVYLHVDGFDVVERDSAFYTKKHSTHSDSNDSTSALTVPVSGNGSSVKVEAQVSGSTAAVKPITDAELAEVSGGKTVEFDLSGLNKNIDTAKLPAETVEKIADKNGMSVKLTTATVTFDKLATQEISDQADGSTVELAVDDVKEVSLNAVQKEAVGKLDTALIIDVYLVSNGTKLCTQSKGGFGGGKATVVLPYEIRNDRTAANYSVYYVDDAGKLEKLSATYDTKLQAFVFEIEHFSVYAVAYDENACPQDSTCVYAKFTDADTKAWYHDGVHFCVENGYMQGVSADKFAPSGTLSRAMIVTMLWRMDGQKYPNYYMTFKDVPASEWYTEAIRWAAAEKIVSGYNADSFGANDPVTREQLATILYNYAKYKGQGFTGSWMFLLDFVDRASISDWADEAVHWCSMKGVVTGKDGKVFDPQGKATRAEAAAMVQRFCETVLK